MADKQKPPPEEDWGPDPLGQDQPSFPPSHQQLHPPNRPPQQQPEWGNQYQPQRAVPETYMTPAILVTVFCFLPTGVAAIIFASQVSAKGSAGDFQGAAQASRRARILVFVSIGASLLFWLIIIIAVSMSDTSTEYMPAP